MRVGNHLILNSNQSHDQTDIGLRLAETFTDGSVYKLLKETYEVGAENFLLEWKAIS